MKPFYSTKLALLIAIFLGLNLIGNAQTASFVETGAVQTYVVGPGITEISVDMQGAVGGQSYYSGYGNPGWGGRVQCLMAVSLGEVLSIYVGGHGTTVGYTGSYYGGGYNGGGNGIEYSGGGGGATDIRVGGVALTNRVVVAAGGGGGGCESGTDNGGNGGGLVGANGGGPCAYYYATGATQTAGGNANSYGGSPGTFGVGGNATQGCCYGGAGGGGWYGGGGSGYIGGGGGGSSYTSPTFCSGVIHSPGYNASINANGICYINIPPAGGTLTPSCLAFGNQVVGSASSIQTVSMNLYNLTGGALTASIPLGFQASLDGVTWTGGGGTLSIPYTGGGTTANIYVQFVPTSYATYSTNICISGGGITGSLCFCVGGNGVFPCTGAPTGVTSVISPTVGNSSTPFSLSLTGVPTGGVTYQWMSSPFPTFGFTAISGATNPTYSFTGITATTYYEAVLTCPFSSMSAPSSISTATDTVTVLPVCLGIPSVGTISADVTSACSTFTSHMGYTSSTSSTTSGLLYQWQTSPDGVSWVPVSGATNLYYTASVASGPVYYDMMVTCSHSGLTNTSSPIILNLLAVPAAITGSNPICMPVPSAMASATSGGTWSSSNTSVAAVTISTGVVTGGTNGTAIISYTLSDGCSATRPVTVSTAPVAISGASGVCVGSSTTAFYDASAGGVWSSTSSSVATIGSTTGIAYGATSGTSSIVYTLPSGCSATSSFVVNPLPAAIGGTAHVCFGSTTTLTDATAGGTWVSSNFNATVGATSGVVTGAIVGAANIIYTLPTGCTATLPITINALPNPITSTSGSSLCTGAAIALTESSGAGTWSSTNTSIATVGSTTGIVTGVTSGSPSIVFTSAAGCTAALGIMVNPLPSLNTVTVTNGGYYCTGGTGVHIGLSGSTVGINYDLWSGGVDLSGDVPGSSSALDFGAYTTPATYNVIATNPITGCQNNMTGTATVILSPLPNVYTVSGGGTYCSGTSGAMVNMSGSDAAPVSYQLYNSSVPTGTLVSGTGSAMVFGPEAAIGTYTVSAVNTSTGCANYMSGSATVNAPTILNTYAVMGGGNYCTGSTTGVDVSLSGSDAGVTYSLNLDGVSIYTVTSALGGALDFGLQTGMGTYTVGASLGTCTQAMSGSAVIGTLPLPAVYTLTGGGNYCAGTLGTHIGLSYSTTGINYQLYNSTGLVNTVGGSFSGLDFGVVSAMDTYFAIAVNPATGCSDTMTGMTTVGVNPLPNSYTVSTGGAFCAGGTGIDVNLSGSDAGVNYQLYNGTAIVGIPMSSILGGTIIDFGNEVSPGTYTVMATNPVTTCSAEMTGSSVITVNALPIPYNVTGGGNYCTGGAGSVISLSNSQVGVTYNVNYTGGGTVGSASGTGSATSLGSYTGIGNYTVQGVIGTCVSDMNGSVNIATNPLPGVYPVTGGGIYCSGSTGVHVGLGVTNTGINYQLYVSGAPSGLPVAGTGFTYDFGLKTTPGTYQVVATNGVTGCSDTMGGSVTVGVNAAPDLYTVSGGGPYCAGGSGANVSLSNSDYPVKYNLYVGSSLVSTTYGVGGTLSFGNQTTPGIYTVVGYDSSTGCILNMAGSTTVVVEPVPNTFTVGGGGSYCASSATGVPVTLGGSALGVEYILSLGGSSVYSVSGTGGSVTFPSVLTAGSYTVEGVNVGTGCSSAMTGSATVNILPVVVPTVLISTGMGDTVCAGGPITFTAMTTNGGSAPTYNWSVTTGGVITAITGVHGDTYSYMPVNGDEVSVTMTSNAPCPSPATASNSQGITVSTGGVPSVAISTSTPSTNICAGTPVTLTASPTLGGATPSYSWVAGGVASGSGPTFTLTPSDGEVVFVVMTSDQPCRTLNTVNSTDEVFNVLSPVAPIFTISANPGVEINKGAQVTFTTNFLNSIPSASFAWTINNNTTVLATTSYFQTSSLHNNDTVKCTVTSITPLTCGDVATTNMVVMSVSSLGVANVNNAANDIIVVPNPNNGSFTVKGSLAVTTDQQVTLEVTNMIGQVVYTGQVLAKNGVINNQVQLNGNLANGMYMLNIHSESGNSVFHFVVEQ